MDSELIADTLTILIAVKCHEVSTVSTVYTVAHIHDDVSMVQVGNTSPPPWFATLVAEPRGCRRTGLNLASWARVDVCWVAFNNWLCAGHCSFPAVLVRCTLNH